MALMTMGTMCRSGQRGEIESLLSARKARGREGEGEQDAIAASVDWDAGKSEGKILGRFP